MASSQFRGIGNVLKAYNYKEVEVWAIFEGKRLQHKGTGESELQEYLQLLSLGDLIFKDRPLFVDIIDLRDRVTYLFYNRYPIESANLSKPFILPARFPGNLYNSIGTR